MSTGVSDCAPHCSFLIEQKRPFEVETYREMFGASDRHGRRSGSALCDSYHEPTTISQQLFNPVFTSTTRGSLLSLIQTGRRRLREPGRVMRPGAVQKPMLPYCRHVCSCCAMDHVPHLAQHTGRSCWFCEVCEIY